MADPDIELADLLRRFRDADLAVTATTSLHERAQHLDERRDCLRRAVLIAHDIATPDLVREVLAILIGEAGLDGPD